MQIKSIVKMSAMLNEVDKKKQLDTFNKILKESVQNKGSSIIPVDLKADYIPLDIDPKLIDSDTLDFIQSKILGYYGVSKEILSSNYSEDDFNPSTVFIVNLDTDLVTITSISLSLASSIILLNSVLCNKFVPLLLISK